MSTATNIPRTVLVVDDFDDTRLLLRTWLERRGFRVVEAENGLQAIDQAVFEYKQTLEQDPEDELSGEMLDSVMNEKMNLLREFSEL